MRHRTCVMIAIGVIAVAAVSGCSRAHLGDAGDGSSVSAGSGTLRGHLYGVGGPAPGVHQAWAGTVTVSGGDFRRDISVAADGVYSVTLPAGRYTVVGHSPSFGDGRMSCVASGDTQVTAGATSTLDVLCHMR
jgi:hypothetical protein